MKNHSQNTKHYIATHTYLYVLIVGMILTVAASWQMHKLHIDETQDSFERVIHKNYALLERTIDWKMIQLQNEGIIKDETPLDEAVTLIQLPKIIDDVLKAGGRPSAAIIARNDQGAEQEIFYEGSDINKQYPQYFESLTIVLQEDELILDFYPTNFFIKTHGENYVYAITVLLTLLTVACSYYQFRLSRQMRALDDARVEAQQANRLKNEFLATMSHEIRSPMSGVLGMAELLMQTQQTDEQRGYTKTIITSGETLLDIIEDILDFSKIEADKIVLDPIPINMLELVDDLCRLYAPKAREKALELAVRYFPGTEQFVYADPVRVRQVLSNLINNAIKFTEKGFIIITVQEDKVKTADQRVNLLFTVEDTGIGVAKESHEIIFEKFTQADSSTTRDFGGTGLGLSICKRLIEMMDGTISIESEKNKGATFRFNLPLVRNQNESFVQARPPVLKDIKVLVVDDLEIIRTQMSEQLTLAGMRCTAVSSGEEALDALQKAVEIDDPYKIVVIDYLMIGMNGEMLARAIHDEPDFQKPCLVMLTAAGNPAALESFARKGFSACISKPVPSKILIDTLSAVWSKFREGATDIMIRVDTNSTEREKEMNEPKLEGARILLAEDSRINQAFAEDVLEQLGCKTFIVLNGKEAVDVVQREAFDLVLMDCQMPVMDGFEAARQIKNLKKNGAVRIDLPIIALTANAMKGDRQKCLDAGMDDYLSKPVRTKDLKEKVYYWITRKQKSFGGTEQQIPAQVIQFTKHDDVPPANDLIDLIAMEESRAILKDKYPAMLTYFGEEVTMYLDEIKTAIDSGIIDGVTRPAHTIKSTSKRMGAAKLSVLAKDMEIAARENAVNPDQMRLKLAELKSVFEASQAALLQQQKAS